MSRTLTVRFSLTIFVALLLIALWAYLGTRRILFEQLDRGLVTAYQIERAALIAGDRLPHHGEPTVPAAFAKEVNRFVALRDSLGAITEINTPGAAELPLDTAGFARARAGQRVWTTDHWGHGPVRSLFGPATEPGAVLQVAASLGPIEDASRTVLLLMLGTVLLGTSATVFGAGWLARVAVEPVQQVAEQAAAVRPGEVGHRITVHADVMEFDGLIRVLNHMLERVDHGLEAERRIIANVGHDLRTPITAMRGEIEIALRGGRTPETYRSVLASVLEEVDHLASLAEALLLLARIEARELEPDAESVDVRDLAAQAIERAGSRSDGRSLTLSGEGDTVARVDAGMMRVVLDQLLDNAIKHTPVGTSVGLTVRRGNGRLTVVVEDDGPGVPADILPHLFERFYRGDAARTRGGAGLGLTIAKAIAEAHGGEIVASRSTAGGLIVALTLPVAQLAATASPL